ncbi:hypothetical protein HPP92_025556 [Vanilla planifolia]|uniref:Uncharacterized protein n=1 Tax=Vanilla planifolia TaxID=51239 RepID=A0A835UAB4_VANPL|nr:hypothetical protein HPP92_025556 [Vanilla planifolia]
MRFANGSAYPPDLNLITKVTTFFVLLDLGYLQPQFFVLIIVCFFRKRDMMARTMFLALLTVISDPPAGVSVKIFLRYEDGTPAATEASEKGRSLILSWAAEPEMEERKLVSSHPHVDGIQMDLCAVSCSSTALLPAFSSQILKSKLVLDVVQLICFT